MNKRQLHDQLMKLLEEKIALARKELEETRAAGNSDTRSSAGDKHEVGRAMVQLELDKLEAQLARSNALKEELARVPLDRQFTKVAFGALVRTDAGNYFFSIGLGKVDLGGGSCFAISSASPIGQAFKDKEAGDAVLFNGRTITILSIS